jgi:hypothetical protein
MVRAQLLLAPAQRQRLERIAKREGRSLSAWPAALAPVVNTNPIMGGKHRAAIDKYSLR